VHVRHSCIHLVPCEHVCSDNDAGSKVDVSLFRNLIQLETDRLTMLCAVWRSTVDDLPDLSDEGLTVLTCTSFRMLLVCVVFCC